MLLVAARRLKNKKREVLPKKPKVPPGWELYPFKETVIEFFWDWLATDCDPNFTPDGKTWLDQDLEFWRYVMYIYDLWRWAEKRAESPLMQIKPRDLTMSDL